jgi:hypothetical protein
MCGLTQDFFMRTSQNCSLISLAMAEEWQLMVRSDVTDDTSLCVKCNHDSNKSSYQSNLHL